MSCEFCTPIWGNRNEYESDGTPKLYEHTNGYGIWPKFYKLIEKGDSCCDYHFSVETVKTENGVMSFLWCLNLTDDEPYCLPVVYCPLCGTKLSTDPEIDGEINDLYMGDIDIEHKVKDEHGFWDQEIVHKSEMML